jgi:hypothetical protein
MLKVLRRLEAYFFPYALRALVECSDGYPEHSEIKALPSKVQDGFYKAIPLATAGEVGTHARSNIEGWGLIITTGHLCIRAKTAKSHYVAGLVCDSMVSVFRPEHGREKLWDVLGIWIIDFVW